jgi:hypothetical protein
MTIVNRIVTIARSGGPRLTLYSNRTNPGSAQTNSDMADV